MKLFKRNTERRNQAVDVPAEEQPDDCTSGRLKTSVNSQSALNLSTVYRCVEILSNSVAQLPAIPYFTAGHKNKRIMYEHPTYRILTNPSRNLSKHMFFKMLVQDMLLKGNGYAYIDRDNNNNIRQLLYIPAEYVAIYNENIYKDVLYVVYGVERVVEHKDIIHLVNFSNDGIRGISTIHHACQSLEIASENEQQANKALNSNVTGLLSIESSLSDNQIKAARRAWVKNVTEEGGIAVLAGGWKFQPLTVNAHDAQLIESRKFNSIDISRWFGVPTTKLGINDGVSYNGYDAEQLMYLSDTLSPLLNKIETELERKLYSDTERDHIDIKFDISNILRTDLKSRAEYYRTLFNIGVLTINEIRRELDLQSIEYGDTTYIQTNMSTLENIYNNNKQI